MKPNKFYLVNPEVVRNCVGFIMDNWQQMDNPQVTVADKKETRRDVQNKLYWAGWLKQLTAEYYATRGKVFPAETWHVFFKQNFLGMEIITLPDGTETEQLKSTTKLTVKEFAEYLEQIQIYAATELDIELYSINEDYMLAVYGKRAKQ